MGTQMVIQAELDRCVRAVVGFALKFGGGPVLEDVRRLGMRFCRIGAESSDEEVLSLGNWVLGAVKARSEQCLRDLRLEGPTAETLAKATLDPILWLREREWIGDDEERAVEALDLIWNAITSGMTDRAAALDGLRVDGHGAYRDPLERMSPELAQVFSEVFRPWAKATGARAKPTTAPTLIRIDGGRRLPLTAYNLTRMVVHERTSLHQIAKEMRCNVDSLATVIVLSLQRFLSLYEKAQGDKRAPRLGRLLGRKEPTNEPER